MCYLTKIIELGKGRVYLPKIQLLERLDNTASEIPVLYTIIHKDLSGSKLHLFVISKYLHIKINLIITVATTTTA